MSLINDDDDDGFVAGMFAGLVIAAVFALVLFGAR